MEPQTFDQNNPVPDNPKKLTFSYGLAVGLLMIIASLITLITKTDNVSLMNYVPIVILFVGVILISIAFKKSRGGVATFGSLFSNAFKMVAFVTLLMVVWSVISYYLFPDMTDRAINTAYEKMAQQGNMDDDQIDMALEMTRKYFLTFMIFGVVFTYLIWGAISSVVASLILKRNPDTPNY